MLDWSTSWTIACLWADLEDSNCDAYFGLNSGGGPYLEFELFDGGGRLTVTTGFLTWGSVIGAVPFDGLPHLVAFTFDKSPSLGILDTGTFYVDGVAVANDFEPIFAVPDSFVTEAGINGSSSSAAGVGIMDEWACWNRALSAGEIASLQAARGSFAAYNSAVLSLSPTAYYHLDEFLPTAAGPGGYLGLVGGLDPCSADALASLIRSETFAWSFWDSPYGFLVSQTVADGSTSVTLTPYVVDPLTLEITVGSTISHPMSNGPVATLDDSTVILESYVVPTTFGAPWQASLYVLKRSGLSLSVSGAQQVLTSIQSPPSLLRLDSTHFLRTWVPSPATGQRVDVFSVSGSTISLVHSELSVGTQTATVDGGAHDGSPSPMSNRFFPLHYDGAGTLYGFGSATGGSPTLFGPCVLAIPFSYAGGIGGGFTLATRARDAQNVAGPLGAIEGTNLILLLSSSGYTMGFYDDGVHMHFPGGLTSDSTKWIAGQMINHGTVEQSFPDYIAGSIEDSPGGPVYEPGRAVQSGDEFTVSTFTPLFLCPPSPILFPATRHQSNLGVVWSPPPDPFGSGFGLRLLRAFKW